VDESAAEQLYNPSYSVGAETRREKCAAPDAGIRRCARVAICAVAIAWRTLEDKLGRTRVGEFEDDILVAGHVDDGVCL